MTDEERLQQLQDKKRLAELQAKKNASEDEGVNYSKLFLGVDDIEDFDAGDALKNMGSNFADQAETAARFFNRGVTFNQSDKIYAGLESVLPKAIGGGASYDEALQGNRDKNKELKEKYPNLATGSELGGNILGFGKLINAGATATRLVPKTMIGLPQALANTAAGATDAAVIGGISAFGDDRDISNNASLSGGIGGGITAAMTLLPLGIRTGLDKIFKSQTGKTAIEKVAGQVPPNLTAEAGSLMQHAYQKVLGVAYGGGGKVYKQGRAAIDKYLRKHTKELNIWSQKMFNKAAPFGYVITKGGHEGAKQLKNAVTKSYDAAWKDATIAPGGRLRLTATADDITENASASNANRLKNFSKDLKNPALTAQDLDKTLRTELKSAGAQGDAKAVEQIKFLRAELRDQIPFANNKALSAVDDIYPTYLTVTDATGRKASLLTQGKPTADTLLSSSAKISKGAASFGDAPLQQAIARRAIKDREFDKYIKKLEQKLPDKSPAVWQRGIANAAIGSATGSAIGLATGGAAGGVLGAINPVTHALSVPIAAAAARPSVQKMLSGNKIFSERTDELARALRRRSGMATGALIEQ